jgi:hypothetical protein
MNNPILNDKQHALFGLQLVIVEPGTEITDERTGQKEVVGDDGAVKAGNTMYCTKPVYARLMQEFLDQSN